MGEKASQEVSEVNLYRCSSCACCFCTEADLKRHIEVYGQSKNEHQVQFRRNHARLEHGSFGGSE
jgi:hypothetical protein